jgi:hypothetical protein
VTISSCWTHGDPQDRGVFFMEGLHRIINWHFIAKSREKLVSRFAASLRTQLCPR